MEKQTQKHLNVSLLKASKKSNRRALSRAIGFYIALSVIVIAATLLKLIFSPDIQASITSGVHFISAISTLLILAALLFYLLYTRRELVSSGRDLYVIGTVVAFGFIVNLYLEFVGIFAIPAAITAFILAPILKRRRDAFIANLFCNFLLLSAFIMEHLYSLPGTAGGDPYRVLDIVVMFIIGVAAGSVAAYLTATKPGRLAYVIRALLIGLASYTLIVGYALLQGAYRSPYLSDPLTRFCCTVHLRNALTFGLIASFAPIILGLLMQPILESAFNLLTDSRLMDLTDHNAPLIKRLRQETPGTFNHSLSVAAFAEMCASAIGENPYLARAAAYYHDVGKLENPEYYKENQGEKNLHDELLPEVSADIIRKHTDDGLLLCDRHRIPIEVSHVTVQHHGNMIIPVFYNKAQKLTDSIVDKNEYSYHGVTPRSKVAAIIMLCDAAEATLRAMGKATAEQIEDALSAIVFDRIESKQFDKCEISLKDLMIIKQTIVKAHGGLFHTRITYPNGSSRA